jgi:hypothetical protein
MMKGQFLPGLLNSGVDRKCHKVVDFGQDIQGTEKRLLQYSPLFLKFCSAWEVGIGKESMIFTLLHSHTQLILLVSPCLININ